jgi:hypothetical protein
VTDNLLCSSLKMEDNQTLSLRFVLPVLFNATTHSPFPFLLPFFLINVFELLQL